MSLKLEVGKTYETKDGGREHVVAYVPINPITGKPNPKPYVAMSAGSEVYRYREDGALSADGVPTSYDLVCEHVPSPTLKEACETVDRYLNQFGGLNLSPEAEDIHRKIKAALAADAARPS